MYMIYAILIFLFIILIMPINFRFLYDDDRSDIEIQLIKFFNLKIDVDKFIRFLLTNKYDRNKITFDSIVYKMVLFFKGRRISKWVIRRTRLIKSSILIEEDIENYLLFIMDWTAVNVIKNLFSSLFSKTENNYYMVLPSNKRKISLEIVVQMRIIFLILAIIFNMKDVFKTIKFMREYYGKSNI